MVFKDSECEFCGKEKEFIVSTSFGCYCSHCLQIMIDELETGLEEIKIQKFLDN